MNYVVDRNGIFVKCYIDKENEMIYNKIIPYIPIDNNENKKELKSFENALKIMGLCFRNVIENSHNPSIYNNNYNYIADIILNYTCRISQNGYANFSKDFISQFVPDYNQLVFIYILFKQNNPLLLLTKFNQIKPAFNDESVIEIKESSLHYDPIYEILVIPYVLVYLIYIYIARI